ncbi:MarR family winged helix-turn-helix transcriptional regulator [Flagellimonas pacifica]|uniref:DNA-binding transcriptional regulator, MarR family n=1 Tax=Flagellimonas pacifica TaxID=1247520 RepID=A0A285MUM1_9FLAO|nr:MarR family winged helix-turn-helix transcriptional regulator [Allomuricauda parva]SNZ00874.1 DNA-binding transcriptional regulator, MarR family [Allomuricauda parva]
MKRKSVFDPGRQQIDLSSKIVTGLERISQAFKVLLWEKAKQLGLSPIQIQILIFVAYHKSEFNNVSFLAQEFNVTKPTISDAIRVLIKKDLVIKDHSSADNRSYTILLSGAGKNVVSETEHFTNPLTEQLELVDNAEKENLFKTLSKLIYQLNQIGVLTVQRTCFGCKFYQGTVNNHYCHLLEKQLKHSDIRLDCVEFEERI